VGNSANNSLYSVNSALGLNPLRIGVGTNAPTEQLHTTAGVRFQGITQNDSLTRILVQNNGGKLFWRDASTLITPPNNNFWSLTGNTSTIPGTGAGQNYLGTTDNQRMVLATNATERMTILPTGQVGIGNTNPAAGLLTVGNGTAGIGAQGSQLYTFQLLGRGVNAVEHLGFFNNDQTTSRSELTVSNSGNGRWEDNFVAIMVHGSAFSYQNQSNYYLNQNNSGYALINAQSNATANVPLRKFAIGVRSPNIPLSFYTNNVERIFITAAGQTGIATTTPTAALHINCTGIPATGASNIRFENLQQGAGNYLVIDANGYVQRSASSSANKMQQNEVDAIKAELINTRQELADLKAQVNALLGDKKISTPAKDINTNTLEIVPTPFSNNPKAVYSIENFKGNATLQIIDANGTLLKAFSIYQTKGQIELGNINMASGFVIFNIVADGKSIISKKSVKL
jgi:hypothetical protein